jgi:transposase
MKPYSKDLRLRVLSAVDRGVPREEVAKTFSVSMPTITSALAKKTSRDRGCGAKKSDPR